MLHLTNGDATATLLRQTGLTGSIVPWRDVLHLGPVRAGLALEAMSDARARFVAACRWAPLTVALRQFGARDAALRSARRAVLWFEHDLYDQLQLLQILAIVAEQPDTRAELIAIGAFPGVVPFRGLGQLSPAQLATLWPQRRPVGAGALALAARAWRAFTSPDPLALPGLVAGELGALPFLRPALLRLLEEHPQAPHGLGRTDRQILQAVAAGHTQADALFQICTDMESAPFLGDTAWRWHLDALVAAPSPLVTRAPYRLTPAGRRVLDGEVDARVLNGLDRWIGGVHLRQRAR